MSRYTANIITKSPATPTGPTTTGRAPGIWRMDDVAYWTKQGLWPNANISAPDTYFPYVSLLLSTTALGNANNNLFVDSSGAFNPISRNGNTTQGSFTPYSTNWSNYFDGSGDYINAGSNAAFAFGTGDFTVEFWFNTPTYRTSGGYFTCFLALGNYTNSPYFRINQDGRLTAGITASYEYYTTSTVQLNTWTHFAVTRSGSTIRLFVNGVLENTQTNSISLSNSLNTYVGTSSWLPSNETFTGYLSNVRIVKGTALYTANFTVPTSPVTAVSGTSLLTCQSNRFRDASTNNLTLTVTGDTRVTDFGPFSPAYPGASYNQSDITNWSGFFDGTGDYLSVANSSANNLGTNDFTIELWFQSNTGTMNTHACLVASYSSPTSGSWAFKAQSGTSGYIQFASYGPSWNDWVTTTNIASDRQWHHCAVTRSGNTLRIFVDGAVAGTWDISGASSFTGGGHPLTTGFMAQDSTSYLNGNLSNVRIVQGTALYTSAFTPPTSPLTAISGTVYLTCQNPAFTDNSTNNLVITQNGNPTVAGNSPFNTVGYWSNYFDGSGDYLTVPSNAALAFGTGDFTIEFWTYRISGANTDNFIISSASNGGFFFGTKSNGWGYGSTGNFWSYNTGVIPTLNTWQHVAISRSGTSIRIFVNGSQIGTTQTDSSDWSLATGGTTIGSQGSSYYYNGYLSNIRVLKGTALYTANFTPPTAPLTAITNTSLLTCQNGSFKDNSTNNFTLTRTGDVSVQSFDPFYTATIASNGGSMYFDGSGDFLNTATNFPPIGTGDFTAECWWYPVGTASQEFTYFSVGDVTSTSGFALATDPARGLFLYSAGYANTSGVAMPVANAWNHIVFTRQSGSLRLYLNGSLRETVSWTNSINAAQVYVGRAANGYFGTPLGYMSNIRYSGTSLYSGSTYTVPTAPLTPSANTGLLVNGMNAGIYDATTINDLETVGNAQVSTVQSKFGGSSVYFDGSGDYLVSRGNTILLGSGNFTVEFWVYFNAVNNGTVKYLYDFRTASATSASFLAQEANNTWTYWNGAGSSVNTGLSGSTFATGQWYHVAITRSSNVLYCFVNGIKVSSDPTDSSNYASATMTLGARYSGSDGLNGYIDDVRLTAGVARYTANFTPPDKAFPMY